MKTTNIVAIDPGEVCGVAVHRVVPQPWHSACPDKADVWTLELPWIEACSLVQSYVDEGWVEEVAWERFDIGQETLRRPGAVLTLEVIGVLRWLAETRGLPTHAVPRQVKKVVDRAMLERCGLHKATPDGHANAAAAVLVNRLHRTGCWSRLP